MRARTAAGSRLDPYQPFGFFALAVSLLFLFVIGDPMDNLVFVGGLAYGLLLIFHRPLEASVNRRITKPLRAYGMLVVANGLFLETLAYAGNLPKIRAGKPAYVFSTHSLIADILHSLPYYLTLAGVFSWSLKHYDLTALELGLAIWLFWAIFVDNFAHSIALLHGDIIGFVLSGIVMLFTLHGPVVLFDRRLRQEYPERSKSWRRWPVVFFLQILSVVVTILTAAVIFLATGRRELAPMP